MSNIDLYWESVEPQDLISRLTNYSSDGINRLSSEPSFRTGIELGFYMDSESKVGSLIPCLILLSKDRAKEAISWVHTYAPSCFPLSQFCRVMYVDDFQHLSVAQKSKYFCQISDVWASIILGEYLSQTMGVIEIPNLAYGTFQACYSHIEARSESLYCSEFISNLIFNRLNLIQDKHRSLGRLISVSELAVIWGRVKTNSGMTYDFERLLSELEFFPGPPSDGHLFSYSLNQFDLLRNRFDGLFSDSIEKRVSTFKALAIFVRSDDSKKYDQNSMSQLIAVGSLIVGRGTSHYFLLKEFAKNYPTAYLWYSLYAGMLGRGFWDESWAMAIRGIKKLELGLPEPLAPVASDLCWPEYQWIAETFNGTSMLKDIPRLQPRAIAVELFPGLTIHQKLTEAEPVPVSSVETLLFERDKQQEEMKQVIRNFVDLALHARQFLNERDQGYSGMSQSGYRDTYSNSPGGRRSGLPKKSGKPPSGRGDLDR